MRENGDLQIFQSIGEVASFGLFIYNVKDEKLQYVNRPLTKIFDISHSAFAHQIKFFINHVIPEEIPYLECEVKKLQSEGKLEDLEFRIKCHDGTIKDILATCFQLNPNFIAGFIRDITKIREHENYIIDYGARKDALLDVISHNLSGPLHLSEQIIHRLEQTIEKNKNIQDQIHLIKSATRECIEIVNDLLEEEHLTSAHIFPKKTRFDALSKIAIVLERIRSGHMKKKISLECERDSVLITSDEVKYFQVVHNLVSNALKFTAEDGVVKITVKDDAQRIVVTVSDNGIGIPDSLKNQLFKRNTPAGRPGLKGEKSIGMGLYICKQLIEMLQGKNTFESRENEGSSFQFELPKETA